MSTEFSRAWQTYRTEATLPGLRAHLAAVQRRIAELEQDKRDRENTWESDGIEFDIPPCPDCGARLHKVVGAYVLCVCGYTGRVSAPPTREFSSDDNTEQELSA